MSNFIDIYSVVPDIYPYGHFLNMWFELQTFENRFFTSLWPSLIFYGYKAFPSRKQYSFLGWMNLPEQRGPSSSISQILIRFPEYSQVSVLRQLIEPQCSNNLHIRGEILYHGLLPLTCFKIETTRVRNWDLRFSKMIYMQGIIACI